MADPLADLSPGVPLPTAASTWNPILRAARAHRDRPRPPAPPVPYRQTGYVEALAVNDTGADLREYKPAAVTAAGGYTVTGDAGHDWTRAPLLTLDVPGAATDMVAVTLEAIPAGGIGRVAVAGCVLCDVKVNGSGDGYASPTTNTTALESAATGSIRILHKGTGSSTRRCAVYLGDQITGGGSTSVSHTQTYSTGMSLTQATGVFEAVITSPSLSAGTYYVSYMIEGLYRTNTVGDYLQSYIRNGANTAAYLGGRFCSIQVANVDVYDVAAGCFVATLSGSGTMNLECKRVFAGTVTTSDILGAASGYHCGLTTLKIG